MYTIKWVNKLYNNDSISEIVQNTEYQTEQTEMDDLKNKIETVFHPDSLTLGEFQMQHENYYCLLSFRGGIWIFFFFGGGNFPPKPSGWNTELNRLN